MESNILNRLEEFDSLPIWHSTEQYQKWQTAAVTGIVLLVGYIVWPRLTYETTIKRTIYEAANRLVPDRFVEIFFRLVSKIAAITNSHKLSNIANTAPYSSYDSPLNSVAQRARAFSGLERVASAQEVTFPGLGNWDNSCFQNSVLQGLASLTDFSDYVQEGVARAQASKVQAATYEGLDTFLAKLQRELNGRETVWPPSILRSMNTWQQQDAQEYFSKVIESLEKEDKSYLLSTVKKRMLGLACLSSPVLDDTTVEEKQLSNSSPLKVATNPIEGAMSQMLRCQSCQHSDGMSILPFTSLTLNLGLGGNCWLEDLLDMYTEPELIDGVECEKCTKLARNKEHDEAQTAEAETVAESRPNVLSTKSKRILFSRLPQNLVFHLNRSIFDDWGNQRKNTAFVQFPLRLEIVSDWVAQLDVEPAEIQATYELRCIVTHQGRHDNGHYIACGKRGKDWFSFNDEIVTKVGEEDVLRRGNVFMLFYAKLERPAVLEVPVSFSDCQEDQTLQSNGSNDAVAIESPPELPSNHLLDATDDIGENASTTES